MPVGILSESRRIGTPIFHLVFSESVTILVTLFFFEKKT